MSIGNNLKEYLKDNKKSIRQLAKEINVPATTLYSFIDRDSSNINSELLKKIAAALNVSVRDLAFYNVDKNSDSIIVNNINFFSSCSSRFRLSSAKSYNVDPDKSTFYYYLTDTKNGRKIKLTAEELEKVKIQIKQHTAIILNSLFDM